MPHRSFESPAYLVGKIPTPNLKLNKMKLLLKNLLIFIIFVQGISKKNSTKKCPHAVRDVILEIEAVLKLA